MHHWTAFAKLSEGSTNGLHRTDPQPVLRLYFRQPPPPKDKKIRVAKKASRTREIGDGEAVR